MLDSKIVYNTILFLIFLLACLVLIRYVSSKEGFANPVVEIYDLHEFFKSYPIAEICPIYNDVFQKILVSQKLDDQGKPFPDDIALENANKYLKTEIVAGVLPCPFQLPEKNDLDTSLEFAQALDSNLLSKAMNTLLFCAANIKKAIDDTNDAIRKKPKRVEGFITECSSLELGAASVVPLQCVPPATMKASEKQEIESEDKTVQQVKQSKKIEITKKLLLLANNYASYMKEFRNVVNREVENLSKKFLQLEVSFEFIKKRAEKEDDDDARKEIEKSMDSIVKEKTSVQGLLQKMLLYQMYQDKSMTELIQVCKKNIAELKVLEEKMKTGEISL